MIYQVDIHISIIYFGFIPRPRSNFYKADLWKFSIEIDEVIGWVPAKPESYDRFIGAVISAEKVHTNTVRQKLYTKLE